SLHGSASNVPMRRLAGSPVRPCTPLRSAASGAIIHIPVTKEAPMTLGDTEPGQFCRGEAPAAPAASPLAPATRVTFDRGELDRIFNLYGRMVAAGQWRDYAIDYLGERAVFSVFRRSSEFPVYRIEKNPRLSRRQGAYSVISATGLIVRRGHELGRVLRSIDRSLSLVAG